MGAVLKFPLFVIVLLLAMPVSLAFAQVPPVVSSSRNPYVDYMSTAQYKKLVRQAIESRPANFEFGVLRVFYTDTEEYDPLGEKTLRRMVNLSYTIENDPDAAKKKTAFDEYGELVAAHMANIDVVSQALVFAKQDKIYGDPKFFTWMRNGLLRSLLDSGDGTSLVKAYDIITLGEEAYLMNLLRLKVLKTDVRDSDGVYYTMYQVQETGNPETYWIFVDTSKPMRLLDWQKNNPEFTYSIQRQ